MAVESSLWHFGVIHSVRFGGAECLLGFSQPQELLLCVPPSHSPLPPGSSDEGLMGYLWREKGAFILGTL